MSARVWYGTALAGYFGLFVLLLGWHGWISPPEIVPRSLVLLILVGPLMFPLRGLLHGRPYTFAWTSYLAMFYFVIGVAEAFADPAARVYGLLLVLFSSLLYLGAILFARQRGRELKAGSVE